LFSFLVLVAIFLWGFLFLLSSFSDFQQSARQIETIVDEKVRGSGSGGVVGFSSLNAFYWKSLTDVRGRLEYGNSRWQEEAGESKFDVRSSFTKETLHIRHEIIQKKNQRTICYICIRPSSLYLPRHKNNKNRYTREKFECGNWKNKNK
jgi:hypothetical protein